MKTIIFIIATIFSVQIQAQTFVQPNVLPGNCMRDANDPLVSNSREDIKRSVFRFYRPLPGGLLISNCTGTLINRNTSENDVGQYFITSWHCFNDPVMDFNSTPITFFFNYQSPPNHLGQVFNENKIGDQYSIVRYVRLVDRVSDAYGDVAICEILGEPIPPHFNPYFTGWSPAATPTFDSYITFGHPHGSTKQVAATNFIQDGVTLNIQTQSCQFVTKIIDFTIGWIWKRRYSTSVICQFVQVPFIDSRYWVYGYTYGNTDKGASGSALFLSNNRFIGNLSTSLHTGCSNTSDNYGKFNSYYPRQAIKKNLYPSNKCSVDISGGLG